MKTTPLLGFPCGLAAWIAFVAPFCTAAGSSGDRDGAIDVGGRKQLFIDDKFIESSRNIELTMNPPRRTGELLITADQPHEEGGYVHIYSSVLKDEDGRIRIWYDLVTATGPGPYDHERRVCYAESEDGLRFVKPELGLHEVGGSTANNVVLPGVIGGCAVWIDPNAPPEHRYKTQAKSYRPTTGFLMHGSPDGIHWDLFAKINPRGAVDTQTIIFWDKALQRYLFYGRDKPPRKVRRAEMTDLTEIENTGVAIWPDELDQATYDTAEERGPVDYYGATVFPYEDAYIMLAQAFWHWMPRGAPGTRDVRLAVSRDSKVFGRVGNRAAFLRPGPGGQFDSKQIWALPNPVRMGDELWIYYAGMNWDRVNPAGVDPQAPDGNRLSGISRAIMRLDGFVSADAPYEGGELVTPAIRFAGKKLELNIDTGGGGSVLVELLEENLEPIEGFTRAEAAPVNGNSVRMPVRWGEVSDVGALAGKPVRIRFMMRDCKLYAFQFTD